jgi:hypothetical protein
LANFFKNIGVLSYKSGRGTTFGGCFDECNAHSKKDEIVDGSYPNTVILIFDYWACESGRNLDEQGN